MVYALCLAGGNGTRMGNVGTPKQFLLINQKPIIIYTLEKLLENMEIDKVIAVCNPNYCEYLKVLLKGYDIDKKVEVISGSDSRLNSTLNGINYIKNNYGINEDDIFIAHDAVRPFTSSRIFSENINQAKIHKAATTVYDLSETISEVDCNNKIYKLYPRKNLFSGQSPQTFNINYFIKSIDKIPEIAKNGFTDLAECIVYNNETVVPIKGEKNNIKITTPIDLIVADTIIQNIESTNL